MKVTIKTRMPTLRETAKRLGVSMAHALKVERDVHRTDPTLKECGKKRKKVREWEALIYGSSDRYIAVEAGRKDLAQRKRRLESSGYTVRYAVVKLKG